MLRVLASLREVLVACGGYKSPVLLRENGTWMNRAAKKGKRGGQEQINGQKARANKDVERR